MRCVGLRNRHDCPVWVGRKPEPCCAVSGIRLCPARHVDQGQLRESKMSALKIIRKRAMKAINLEAARNLMARRQLAGA